MLRIRTLIALLALLVCAQASRVLQQDAGATDPTLVDRTRPDWYVAMELQQQQHQQQQQQQQAVDSAALVELASLATAASSAGSAEEADGTAGTRAAAVVRAAAKPARKTPARRRSPKPKAQPPPAPKPSPAPSPSPSPTPSPKQTPSPSPSPTERICLATPTDVLGPFYQAEGVPLNTRPDESFCALKAGGSNATKITITGRVQQTVNCTRVVGGSAAAYIDVWQANNAGEYDNNQDVRDSECRTRVPIGADGTYKYTTYIPAAYGSRTCLRPPHIHLRVAHPCCQVLVTQMYFAGNGLNGPNDCGCGGCGSGNPLQLVAIDPATGAGVFDITLRRQR